MKWVIFGAGLCGREALKKTEYNEIQYFIDNNPSIVGNVVEGIEIKYAPDFLEKEYEGQRILVCASYSNQIQIINQLEKNGILDYEVFKTQLLSGIDFYSEEDVTVTEEKWNDSIENGSGLIDVKNFVINAAANLELFHEIEIETINRCNGTCSFCPVNAKTDTRVRHLMDEGLFYKIIDELHEINYVGRICLFSNNEPLLDPRIVTFSKYVREQLPNAMVHMFTNGTLLTLELFEGLIPYLDELVIDNYSNDLILNPYVKTVKEYVEKNNDGELMSKVKILNRRQDEVLSSRGGEATNRANVMDWGNETCALPFCQMVVRPTGEVSLCCNDPNGRMTLGDLNEETLLEVWYGEKYKDIRCRIAEGRRNIEKCKACDTFMII